MKTRRLGSSGLEGSAIGLLLIGIHNSWDTVTHLVVRGPAVEPTTAAPLPAAPRPGAAEVEP